MCGFWLNNWEIIFYRIFINYELGFVVVCRWILVWKVIYIFLMIFWVLLDI